jgi:hypothetical protein
MSVNGGKARNWPAIQNILYGHSERVRSVAFSPDGSRIVSGSHDQTIRLLDAETGDTICKPFMGHSNDVTSVAFSPDGSRLAHWKTLFVSEMQRYLTLSPHWVAQVTLNFYHLVGWSTRMQICYSVFHRGIERVYVSFKTR